MYLIDGKTLAATIREEVKQEVAGLGLKPRLNVMIVGGDPASHLYVSLKKRAGEEAGINVDVHGFEATASQEQLLETIEAWNNDPEVDAILVQIPLPYGFDQDAVTSKITPHKDVDGFHPDNVAALLKGEPSIVSPVHEGILRLIAQTDLKISGSLAVILANSKTFAEPLARLLSTAGASVDILDPDNLDRTLLAAADIVVTAIGRAGFVHPSLTKDGTVIIDVGTNKTDAGHVRGDADFDAYKNTDCWVTPVPGGVGPMTIALLLRNVVTLAKHRA
ncbi:bifunctional 5,10-methylenetetrahydrofolate dehydrogenase/5,10-methenyltetrahydrofolate cyclohydrolase [Patescibacteria group bacterium]|jgi:methylenetetrahydrofolate dehydrogenase (NADP+)/methenyltetrahydrofolate cyclohydrolase|nr:bifunctional 5,10-methylenetetrahydrofolate dehydrogenase/5,10-methenyltetrahydrofolate cyclohydrolase [Patescibacteria group bacterium]